MTKFFNAQVEVVQHKTVSIQVAAESEAEARAQAEEQALTIEPQFSSTGTVQLQLVGESEIVVGTRVVHRLFGPGTVESLSPSAPNRDFIFAIRFDGGSVKNILGPGSILRPEALANPSSPAPSIAHNKACFRWERIPNTVEIVGTAFNTKARVDPTLFEVLKWCHENIKDGFKAGVEVKYGAILNDDLTGIHHAPYKTYVAKLTFNSEESLTLFFLMWKD